MPPRVRIQKEDIVGAAVELVRKNGAQALNSRSIAAALNCSTQPIFSNFATMEELRLAVIAAADAESQAFIKREIDKGEYPVYKAAGMAYIRFAKEEKELFKLLYMRDRTDEYIPEDTDLSGWMESIVKGNTGVSDLDAKLFHFEMWAYVHGIAVMLATGFLDLDPDLISRMLTDSYQGLKKQFEKE